MNRVCYFIMGAGGSGTRLVQRIIATDPDVKDNGVPGFLSRSKMGNWRYEVDKIVLKRDDGWSPPVNLAKISSKLRKGYYNIFWVFTIRRPARFELAGKNQGIKDYWEAVLENDRYVIWDNSLLFLDPKNYLTEMGLVLGLDLSNAEEIRNEDTKHLIREGIK